MSTAISIGKLISIKPEFRPESVSSRLHPPVFEILTSLSATQKALEKACQLAEPLKTTISILAVRAIPYPLQLDEPPVPPEFAIRRFMEMAGSFSKEIQISVYLCRDPMQVLEQVLNRDSPVVLGIGKRWWPNRDRKLAQRLKQGGYNVILALEE